ncbi:hypothetical protein ALP79_200173 [Pseudomonas savastanoi pv. fraxini]|nr:hypothetical protein ALO60_200150 [Pseudomonas amygdali pv. tabaci]KUG43887.1 hypothetical protein ALP79_200173 [Pseudomonas savastanoi pv. fraxini]
MANLSPIVSEFETDEQAASYDRIFLIARIDLYRFHLST